METKDNSNHQERLVLVVLSNGFVRKVRESEVSSLLASDREND